MIHKEVFYTHSQPVRERELAGVTVLDAGLATRCAWPTAKTLVQALMGGQGEAAFGDLPVAGTKMATLDLFLDEPAKLPLPHIWQVAEGEVHLYTALGFGVGLFRGKLPARLPEGCGLLLATNATGVVAAVYHSWLQTAQAAADCLVAGYTENSLVWGWSTAVLPPLCDDPALFSRRAAAVAQAGTITGLWVRGSDEEAKARMGQIGRGEVRLHNLETGNTFVRGALRPKEMQRALHL